MLRLVKGLASRSYKSHPRSAAANAASPSMVSAAQFRARQQCMAPQISAAGPDGFVTTVSSEYVVQLCARESSEPIGRWAVLFGAYQLPASPNQWIHFGRTSVVDPRDTATKGCGLGRYYQTTSDYRVQFRVPKAEDNPPTRYLCVDPKDGNRRLELKLVTIQQYEFIPNAADRDRRHLASGSSARRPSSTTPTSTSKSVPSKSIRTRSLSSRSGGSTSGSLQVPEESNVSRYDAMPPTPEDQPMTVGPRMLGPLREVKEAWGEVVAHLRACNPFGAPKDTVFGVLYYFTRTSERGDTTVPIHVVLVGSSRRSPRPWQYATLPAKVPYSWSPDTTTQTCSVLDEQGRRRPFSYIPARWFVPKQSR